jgi:ATP-dependent Clp protease ATP-binding subunit ClpC
MMRFDRFTERAQEAAQRAAEIIQRYGHNQIDTEHILLALIEQPGGVIPQILEKLNVSPEALTERLDSTLRASPKANIFGGGAGQIFITPRVKRIIDLANEEPTASKTSTSPPSISFSPFSPSATRPPPVFWNRQG